ncbi:MAG: hypothetical protein CSB48_02365 [Proteobacteria bacterium]|nr:MAG: hypothetical protein CSB48_02365 [Pseudomonadota bacterium]
MVIWTKPARADLTHIHDFIAEDSRHYAKKVAREIREKTDILNELPNAGKMVSEIGKSEIISSEILRRMICLNPDITKPRKYRACIIKLLCSLMSVPWWSTCKFAPCFFLWL